jgi:hypothetical protein
MKSKIAWAKSNLAFQLFTPILAWGICTGSIPNPTFDFFLKRLAKKMNQSERNSEELSHERPRITSQASKNLNPTRPQNHWE